MKIESHSFLSIHSFKISTLINNENPINYVNKFNFLCLSFLLSLLKIVSTFKSNAK